MKSFSKIRSLREDADSISFARSGPLGSANAADTPDVAIWDVTNNESINRINAYLGQAHAKPCIDPIGILRQVQRKLSIIGLQFMITPGALKQSDNAGIRMGNNQALNTLGISKQWEENYPLTYLGGRAGVLDNNYTIGKDDNISHRRGGGLRLNVKYRTVEDSGMTIVTPQILPAV